VVKHADAAEVRIIVTAVLAAAADAVLVAHHLPKLAAHLAHLHVRDFARRNSLEAGSTREKGRGVGWGTETLPQQVINNSAAVQQERLSIYVGSRKLILAAMYLRRVGIDGRSYAAAPALVSTVVTPPTPAAKISA
jgi:hypothetical protein